MKILKALLVTILLSPLTVSASNIGTGMELLEIIKSYENGKSTNTETPDALKNLYKYMYYFGYGKGLIIGDNARTICNPEGVTGEQYMLIVEKYLKDHPEELHESAYLLIDIALMEAFPCEDTEETP